MGHERARTDVELDTVDKALRAALNVDPSPEFLARVRARVADERPSKGWTVWPVAAMVGAVAAILIVAVVASRSTRPQVQTATRPVSPSVAAARAETPLEPRPAPPVEPVQRTGVEQRVRPAGPRPFSGEGQALQELVDAVGRGAVPVIIAASGAPAEGRSTPIPDLAISSITINSIVVDPITQ